MSQINDDILPTMAPFFDVHMTLQLINFYVENKIYTSADVAETKIKLLESTNMVDVLLDIKLFKTIEELNVKKTEILNAYDPSPEVKPIVDFFCDEDSVKALRNETNKFDFLARTYNATIETLTKVYQHAKYLYEIGRYIDAYPILHGLILTFSQKGNTTPPPPFYEGALWGRLACVAYSTFTTNNEYIQAIQSVKNFIDMNSNNKRINASETLKQRSWLLHWSLFIYFSQAPQVTVSATNSNFANLSRWEHLFDLFMDRNYLITIENYCPWLLRYLVIAAILSPNKRKNYLKEILNEINLLNYNDKILTFFSELYTNFDLETSYKALLDCKNTLQNDFFSFFHQGTFYLQARQFILEMYCMIYRDVDLETICATLELDPLTLEPWVMELVNVSKNKTITTALTSQLSNRISYINTVLMPKKYPYDSHRELVNKVTAIKNLSTEILNEQGLLIRAKNRA